MVDDTYANPSPGICVSFAVFSLKDHGLGEFFCRSRSTRAQPF